MSDLDAHRMLRRRVEQRFGDVTSRKILLQFPGQGSQYRGMGSDLCADFAVAKDAYARASEVLGYDLAKLSFEDPDSKLNQTRYTQPALLVHELACLAALESLVDDLEPAIAAGHSLGEYTALVAAGSLTLESGVALVSERGKLMSEHGQGSMLATTLTAQDARGLADKHFCGIGGCNLPEQTVIAGKKEDLEALAEDLKASFKGKRAIELNTEGAFHTYLMVSAAEHFREVLDGVEFAAPRFPVLSNYTGMPHLSDPSSIRSRLFFQLFNPVRWVDCMSRVVEAGVDTVIELGGGIGKGEGPEAKRPNLESVTKKSLNWLQHEAEYVAAINAAGIRSAAEQLANQPVAD